ncbi:hypothetical protein ASG01_12610 [Chryseobacterium sp. Leaf180]|uniref:glycosyltransferase n=1 Tax=Chryseobacterium sp. Leaf180 TaxID=1736289 RepID=UPI0006FBFEF1|nr:glycosyltransferase [Chryseobacterium sp. Leaf180]KQR91842.1 hypothetical protein ASG01_12610 [Chryseobacterium sp. Leaf180]
MNTKLSIILPVYNVEKYLEECIDSLIAQNLNIGKYEIILVNDGSTDTSEKIGNQLCSQYSNIFMVTQPNKGLSAARNTGIEASKGEFIYFIDSDDLLRKNILGNILDEIEKENLDFYGFQSIRCSSREFSHIINSESSILIKGDGLKLLSDYNYNNGVWWYIFKRTALNGLRFAEGRYCEDGIFTTELLMNIKNGKVVSDINYIYYYNPVSIVNSRNIDKNEKIINDMFFVIKYFDTLIKKTDATHPDLVNRLRERQESYLYFAIIRHLKIGSKYNELLQKIRSLEFKNYSVYPINMFKGYNLKDKVLLTCLNKKLLLRMILIINKKVNIIK